MHVLARLACLTVTVFAMHVTASTCVRAQVFWTGAADPSPPNGVYNIPGNWSGTFGLVPGGGDFAIFNADATYTVTFTGNQGVGHASVRGGQVSWRSNSATVRSFALSKLSAGGPNQVLTIGSATNPMIVTSNDSIEAGSLVTIGNGTIVVDGATSALHGPRIIMGSFAGLDGTLRYQNGAQGSISGAIDLGDAASNGSDGLLEILSGADLASGQINLATTTSTATGTINVSGAGSTLLQNGASTLTVGGATGGAGTINVNTGGTFTSGSGLMTLNPTGTISRTGTGVFHVKGDLLVNGGKFLSPGGTFSRSADQMLTVQQGGLLDLKPAPGGTGQIGVAGGTLTNSGTLVIANGAIGLEGGVGGISDGFITIGLAGGAGGVFNQNEGTLTLTEAALLSLQGGRPGGALLGGNGGSGGALHIQLGSVVNIDGGSLIELGGGNGGRGANGGNGGSITLSGGAMNLRSGRISLAGGQGGGSGFNSTGVAGIAGHVNVTGGTFNITSGQITGDSGITPTTPSGLVQATLNVSGGAVNLNSDFTNHLGTLNLTGGGVINGNGVNGTAGSFSQPPTAGAVGRSVVSTGTITIGNSAQLNLRGGMGVGLLGPGGSGGHFQIAGGALHMTGGRIDLSGGVGGSFPGGNGPSGAAGSVDILGGTVNLSAGQITANTSVVPSAPIALVGATMNVSAGTLNTTASAFGITHGATLHLSGGVMKASTVTLDNSAFNFTGGTLHATTVNGHLINAGGTFAPGDSIGTTTVNGNYTQNAGVLAIELGGTGAGQFDKLAVMGTATLGGTLRVSFMDNYVPQIGDSFDILDGGLLSGTFALLNLPGGGLTWNTSQLYTTGALSVGGQVGDYNQDGVVDAADYTVWRDSLGQTGAGLAADGNFNNLIDDGDLGIWRLHFGRLAGSGTIPGTNSAVPEQNSSLLLSIAIAGLTACRRTRTGIIAGYRTLH